MNRSGRLPLFTEAAKTECRHQTHKLSPHKHHSINRPRGVLCNEGVSSKPNKPFPLFLPDKVSLPSSFHLPLWSTPVAITWMFNRPLLRHPQNQHTVIVLKASISLLFFTVLPHKTQAHLPCSNTDFSAN